MGANHWGVRWPPLGRAYGYNSYVLERDGTRMLLACDSAFTPLFEALASKPLDIAAFSIGAYNPWIRACTRIPSRSGRCSSKAERATLVPIHWGTFRLSKEPMDEPIRRLLASGGSRGESRDVAPTRSRLEPASAGSATGAPGPRTR